MLGEDVNNSSTANELNEKPSIEIEIESEFNPAKLYSNLLLKHYLGLQICQFLFALFLLPKQTPSTPSPSSSPFFFINLPQSCYTNTQNHSLSLIRREKRTTNKQTLRKISTSTKLDNGQIYFSVHIIITLITLFKFKEKQ